MSRKHLTIPGLLESITTNINAPKTINQEADELIHGDRQKIYGRPLADFRRTAMIWSAILGITVTPSQVALCMVGLKIARLVQSPTHRDSIVDGCGYFGTLDMVNEDEEAEKNASAR